MANKCNQSLHMTYPYQHLKPQRKNQLSTESVDFLYVNNPNSRFIIRINSWPSGITPSLRRRHSARAFWFGTCSTAATAALSKSPWAGAAGGAGAGAGRAGTGGESRRLSCGESRGDLGWTSGQNTVRIMMF